MNILKKISCLTPLLLAFFSAPGWAGCTYDISNEWGSGFVANIRITNDSSSATSNWNVGWQYSGDNRITSAWGATLSGSNPYSFSNVSWNGTIPPGESVEFGVQGTSGGTAEIPLVTGSVCENSTIPITPTPTSSPTLEPTASPTATPTPTPSAVPTGATPSPSPTPSPNPTTTPAPENELVLQEGELGFCSVDGSIDSNNAGYSGSGFANTDNAIGKKITWKISVASEGSYRLEWRFANGASSARNATVSVNNSQGNIDFSTTGAWSSWTTDGTEINLTAGINDVTLTADTNGGLPNIDSFIILGSGVTAADCNTSSSSSSSSSSSTSSTSSSGGTGFGEICPTASPCRILPFGDSITDGYGTPGGYRIELFKKAVEAGKSITFVGEKTNGPSTVADNPFPRNHQGHSGWTIEPVGSTQGISTKLPSPALDDDPNIILLHIGTNDLRRAPSGMSERLERLVDKILEESPDSLLVVASIVPSNRSDFPNSVVITYNADIPAMVKKKADLGHKIIHVNQYEGFPLSELGDNLHPNENGYARMANKWYESVDQYLH